MEELEPLGSELGGLGAYQDFAFLMDHITRSFRDVTKPASGYSR